ncbi:ribonuclease H1-like [Styela clava]|uniref:ribonuclease H1-like n=1 Tax=Styela clava TaxID=7725 RepID=UPI001939359C|nr:ribonuclease H1-like [Styela clava]
MARFFAVHIGHNPGVYLTSIDCKNQIDGFEGSIFMTFSEEAAAKEFVKTGNAEFLVSQEGGTKAVFSIDTNSLFDLFEDNDSSQQSEIKMETAKNEKTDCSVQKVKVSGNKCDSMLQGVNTKLIYNRNFSSDVSPIVYIYGVCFGNSKKKSARAGYGVWWGEDHHLNFSARLNGIKTNLRAEIAAANLCLKQAADRRLKSLTIRTNSEFVFNCATKWIPGWVKSNWIKTDGKIVTHKPEFMAMIQYMKTVEVHWERVKEREGIRGYKMAKGLASLGATM